MSYEYDDVGLYREKIWVKGLLKVVTSSEKRLMFVPKDGAHKKHAIDVKVGQVKDVEGGEKGNDHFLRLGVMFAGRKKPKTCLFNFGTRKHSVDILSNVLLGIETKVADAAPAVTPTNNSSSSSSSSSSTFPTQQHRNQSKYFEKYGIVNEDAIGIVDDPNVPAEENLARRAMLETDDELLALYKSVVSSNIMTPQEFWASRDNQLAEEEAALNQSRGLSTGLTADLHASSSNQDGISYELTVEQMKRIFIEQPKVHAVYKEVVPNQMKELEFWKLYLQSKYFHQNTFMTEEEKASEEALKAAKVFGGYDDDDMLDTDPSKISLDNKGTRPHGLRVDPAIDLLTTLNDDPHGDPTTLASVGMANRSGYGVVDRRDAVAEEKRDRENREKLRKLGKKATIEHYKTLQNKPLESGPLLSRYNRHAVLVLPDEEHHPNRVRRRIGRAVENEKDAEVFRDLDEAGGVYRLPDPVPLELHDQKGYMAVGGSSKHKIPQTEGKSAKRKRLREWSPDLAKALPNTKTAMRVLNHIAQTEQDSTDRFHEIEQIKDYKELLRVHRLSNELRRQFWVQCPPRVRPGDLDSQSSIIRLKDTVEKLKRCSDRVREFREYARNDGNKLLANLLLDIVEQIKSAVAVWEKFYDREVRKRSKMQQR